MNLECDGAVVVRGYLGQDLWRITEIAEMAFVYLEAGCGDQAMQDLWRSVGVVWLPTLNNCGGVAAEFVDALSRHAERVLGHCRIVPEICNIRRTRTARTQWHTEYHGAGTGGFHPCYNIWIPLTPVGQDQPSIEFFPGSHRRMPDLPPPDTAIFADEWVADHFGSKTITPELAPGDALIFDHWTLHRTQVLPVNEGMQTSIECRVTQRD